MHKKQSLVFTYSQVKIHLALQVGYLSEITVFR